MHTAWFLVNPHPIHTRTSVNPHPPTRTQIYVSFSHSGLGTMHGGCLPTSRGQPRWAKRPRSHLLAPAVPHFLTLLHNCRPANVVIYGTCIAIRRCRIKLQNECKYTRTRAEGDRQKATAKCRMKIDLCLIVGWGLSRVRCVSRVRVDQAGGLTRTV